MQVSAVNDGGKGKKGKKGKNKMTGDKGKGKDKSKHKSSDSSKSKERDSWNSGQQQVQFQGKCLRCSKWGHRSGDCRTRLAQQKNGAVAGIQEPDSERDGVKSVQWSDVDSDALELDSSSWCFAAMDTPRGPVGSLLLDSGADDHICHPDFAKEFPQKKCEVDTERCARPSIISPWHTTRQSESGNTGTASEH